MQPLLSQVERKGRDTTILLQIFDIQGLERYRKQLPRAFFNDAHGAVVVFDCTKDAEGQCNSFYGAQDWKKTIDEQFARSKRPGAPCILVANKSDTPNDEKYEYVRSVTKMERCCKDNNFISWHPTSAMDGRGLKEIRGKSTAFDALIDEMLEWEDTGKYIIPKDNDDTLDIAVDSVHKGGCKC